MSDGVDLGSVTTAGDANADIDIGELVKADNEEGFVNLCIQRWRQNETGPMLIHRMFVASPAPLLLFFPFPPLPESALVFGVIAYLESHDFWLNERDRLAVHFDETLALLFAILSTCSTTIISNPL